MKFVIKKAEPEGGTDLIKGGKGGGPYIGKRGGKWADPMHKIPWSEKKHAGKKEPVAKPHDEHAADELRLHIDNTEEFVNEDRSRFGSHMKGTPSIRGSIHKNLANKVAAGKYDHAKASKLFGHLVDQASKHYGSSGDPVHARVGKHQFDAPTRAHVAREMADDFHDEVQEGEHDHHLNKKHQRVHPKGIAHIAEAHVSK